MLCNVNPKKKINNNKNKKSKEEWSQRIER